MNPSIPITQLQRSNLTFLLLPFYSLMILKQILVTLILLFFILYYWKVRTLFDMITIPQVTAPIKPNSNSLISSNIQSFPLTTSYSALKKQGTRVLFIIFNQQIKFWIKKLGDLTESCSLSVVGLGIRLRKLVYWVYYRNVSIVLFHMIDLLGRTLKNSTPSKLSSL